MHVKQMNFELNSIQAFVVLCGESLAILATGIIIDRAFLLKN